MTIKSTIREWLGITELLDDSKDQRQRMLRIEGQLHIITPGLSRIIAKLDAKYAESEHSPERKAESDKLADEVIARLEAEAKARAPYNQT